MPGSTVRFQCAWPQLLVHDVQKTCEFYRDSLGFSIEWSMGEPARYACVARGEVRFHLMKLQGSGPLSPNHDSMGTATDVYVSVEGVDALYEELKGNGAKITEEISTRPYGMRDFAVEDCNGYRIAFGEEALPPSA